MADVKLGGLARSVSLVNQIRLIAGLRWRLLRNKMRQRNNVLDLIGMGFAGILGAVLVVGMSFAFFAGAQSFLARGRVGWLALLFWAIFIWWQIFPFFLAGFGVSFEFRTLLRFPLSRRAFYLIGLAYGLADFSSLAGICWLLAMTAGVAAAQIALLPAMLLVCGIFVLLNITLERLIGSWLERVLARRRTREIFFALFVLAVLSLQLLNPLLQRYGHAAVPRFSHWAPYFASFPGSLAGATIAGMANGRVRDVLVAAVGLLVYVVVFGSILWLRFAAQYRGEELSETADVNSGAAVPHASRIHASDVLRLLPPTVAEVLRKEFHYLLRNGFSFVLLVLPPFMIVVFTMQGNVRHPAVSDIFTSRNAFFPGMMAYLILALMTPAYNCFAYEGRGIQTYFMSPVRFREVFLGKNLLLAAVLAIEIVLSVLIFSWRVGLPDMPVVLATLAAIVFTVVGQFAIANWSSLSFPRKLNFGQMRGQRQSGMAVLVAFAAQIMLGGISTLLFFAGRWTGNPWLPTEAFVLLAAAAVGGYVASLEPLSNYAEQKKETLVEALCR